MNVEEECAEVAMMAGQDYIVIKGLTEEGKRFRPSDWAERLATAVGQFGADRRVRFHPHVRIATVDGEKCLIVDLVLEDEDPLLFGFLVHFAQDNHLQTEPEVAFDKEGKLQVRVS
jgi:hypothetical protein